MFMSDFSFFIDLFCSLLSLFCIGQGFSSTRPCQTFWDSSSIKVEDEVQSVIVNAAQELSTEKVRDVLFFYLLSLQNSM